MIAANYSDAVIAGRHLEQVTAAYKVTEAAIAFPTGFMANTGTIPALAYLPYFARMAGLPLESATPQMVVVSDALNHASIVDGLQAARAKHAYYAHCDLDALEEKLRQNQGKRLLIVTDGVFSMDGDIAPLPGILRLRVVAGPPAGGLRAVRRAGQHRARYPRALRP